MLGSGGYWEISAGSTLGTWVEGNKAAERHFGIAPTPISLPPPNHNPTYSLILHPIKTPPSPKHLNQRD